MKLPEECNTITEIRNEIDNIDKQIIALIGTRFNYVKQIIKFKSNEEDVLARQRYEEVLLKRREWAEKQNLNPEIIENIYKTLVGYFIDEQMKLLNEK
jgi:isochorismate pyruvate lyase